MAVRSFDVTDTRSGRTTVLEPAPRSRQEVRRSRQHWLWLGAVGLLAPFAAAIITIGVVH